MMRYAGGVRTTVSLDDDVAAEVRRVRRERGVGLSEALNELARAGIAASRVDYVYRHPVHDMRALIDLSNVADVLELLDESDRAEGAARAS
jgi:Ribbon-helix-helix protein, copG family